MDSSTYFGILTNLPKAIIHPRAVLSQNSIVDILR